MIKYEKYSLQNGLRVILYPTKNSHIAIVNIMYDVGSRDEEIDKTGFAHLFEHLMFGGSKNISNYDHYLQKVGGINNAFTSSDVTNYYCMLPAKNLETALWLESDRMLKLAFNPKGLITQKKVVIEEYNEGMNRPYGDYWHQISGLMYKTHPYKWPTIGLDIRHIENAKMDDVKNFFNKFYTPNNAVLVVAGGIKPDITKKLINKWFAEIPSGTKHIRRLPKEPSQKGKRTLSLHKNVPMNAIYKAYHTCGKYEHQYFATDLLCNILGAGKSSRLYEKLVIKEKIFNSIHAFMTDTFDPGLLFIMGHINEGISFEEAENSIDSVINKLKAEGLKKNELEKAKNQTESYFNFNNIETLNIAQELAYGEILGNLEIVNTEIKHFMQVKEFEVIDVANSVLADKNSGSLYYNAIKK